MVNHHERKQNARKGDFVLGECPERVRVTRGRLKDCAHDEPIACWPFRRSFLRRLQALFHVVLALECGAEPSRYPVVIPILFQLAGEYRRRIIPLRGTVNRLTCKKRKLHMQAPQYKVRHESGVNMNAPANGAYSAFTFVSTRTLHCFRGNETSWKPAE